MALSETDIANMALVRLGATPISTLSSTDPGAYQARTLYGPARDTLLRSAPWNFARVFSSLAQLKPAPLGLSLIPDPDGVGQVVYTAAYQLPLDFIRLYRVAPWQAHWRVVGQTLLTDAGGGAYAHGLVGLQPLGADGADNQPPPVRGRAPASVGIEYIARISDPNRFDALFVEALVSRLAWHLSFGIAGLETLRTQLGADYQRALAEALAINGMENWPEQLYDTVLVDVRMGYTSGVGDASA